MRASINFDFPRPIKFGCYSESFHCVVLDNTIPMVDNSSVYMFNTQGELLWQIDPDYLTFKKLGDPFDYFVFCGIINDSILDLFSLDHRFKIEILTKRLISKSQVK